MYNQVYDLGFMRSVGVTHSGYGCHWVDMPSIGNKARPCLHVGNPTAKIEAAWKINWLIDGRKGLTPKTGIALYKLLDSSVLGIFHCRMGYNAGERDQAAGASARAMPDSNIWSQGPRSC